MACLKEIIEQEQTWGVIRYDTLNHKFSYVENDQLEGEPYPNKPVVLNIVVTRRCNMDCTYCVQKDFSGIENEDLVLSEKLIHRLNNSPFMLLVLTGGEPLMPPYDAVSMRLINSIHDKGIILDTNGTFLPDENVLSQLKKKNVMIRVSMDSTLPSEEIKMRHVLRRSSFDASYAHLIKMANINRFISAGINTAVQTVVWQKNEEILIQMIEWLSLNGIKRWYLQRLIPSHKKKNASGRSDLKSKDYYPLVTKFAAKARKMGIECVPKMDMRHNSVFLLTSNGVLYTQGAIPGQKIRLGAIHEDIGYFDYVSAADHACRYYIDHNPKDKNKRSRKLNKQISLNSKNKKSGKI